MTLGRSTSGAIKIKTEAEGGGLRAVSCGCCESFQLTVKYSWEGTGQRDLDTQTAAFGESAGYGCGSSGTYVQWIGGDNTGQDAAEQVDIRVQDARRDGLWSSSYNIDAFAGWYEPAGGSGNAQLIVEYKGRTKTKTISPGQQSGCASTQVATVTVYADQQEDGSFFEIL
jgi:hypothetical protein